MNQPDVNLATIDDRHRVLSTLALAFSSDPLMRWMLPESDRFIANVMGLFDVFAGHSIDGETCLVTPGFEGGLRRVLMSTRKPLANFSQKHLARSFYRR